MRTASAGKREGLTAFRLDIGRQFRLPLCEGASLPEALGADGAKYYPNPKEHKTLGILSTPRVCFLFFVSTPADGSCCRREFFGLLSDRLIACLAHRSNMMLTNWKMLPKSTKMCQTQCI